MTASVVGALRPQCSQGGGGLVPRALPGPGQGQHLSPPLPRCPCLSHPHPCPHCLLKKKKKNQLNVKTQDKQSSKILNGQN